MPKRLPALILLVLCGLVGVMMGCRGRTPSAPDGTAKPPPAPPRPRPSGAVAAPPSVGAPAPDFALPGVDGRTYRLAELTKGGAAIVVFYRGHW